MAGAADEKPATRQRALSHKDHAITIWPAGGSRYDAPPAVSPSRKPYLRSPPPPTNAVSQVSDAREKISREEEDEYHLGFPSPVLNRKGFHRGFQLGEISISSGSQKTSTLVCNPQAEVAHKPEFLIGKSGSDISNRDLPPSFASQGSIRKKISGRFSEKKFWGGSLVSNPEAQVVQVQGSGRSELSNELSDSHDAAGQRKDFVGNKSGSDVSSSQAEAAQKEEFERKLIGIYERVYVVDNVDKARKVVRLLTTKYKNFVHACDTEVSNIDVNLETPVGHGEIICFSIYSSSKAAFGNGKSCVWVDVLDGGTDVLLKFAPFFEDPSIKKVWHNYSFDSHVIANYGIKVAGFHADTMHLARLWDSSRRTNGGYSLEALTSDKNVMSGVGSANCSADELFVCKKSMKFIFGKKKMRKDGCEGKLITVAPVETLQRESRIPWICYSVLDSVNTLRLYESLKQKLHKLDLKPEWELDGLNTRKMYDFYEEYYRPFGDLLVKMEAEGVLVDRAHLSVMEKVALAEKNVAACRFRKWASQYCLDAKYMNVGSDAQMRQLFFGDGENRSERYDKNEDQKEDLIKQNEDSSNPKLKKFKVLNSENIIEEGRKEPTKYLNIALQYIGKKIPIDTYTATGRPSITVDSLRTMAGKISDDQYYSVGEQFNCQLKKVKKEDIDINKSYGTAYKAFGGGKEGRDACLAIASLCEVRTIDSLISNFLLPLQSDHASDINGRIHCSLNINTETGRLSARRPNLQNQPALEKDRYKIRQAFIASPGNSLIVADYGQLELRILAHLTKCASMLAAFKAGGDFHSRTAMTMYSHVCKAVEDKTVLLEWNSQPGKEKPPVPLLKDAFATERRRAKMLNFSIAYGKTTMGLARDWKVSNWEAKETVERWYKDRWEVLEWQEAHKKQAAAEGCVYTLLGRRRKFPSLNNTSGFLKGHIERAAINTPVQGSAADVAMCAMLEIDRNPHLKKLGWKLILQVHDEVILEGPTESREKARAIVVECMSKPFYGKNILNVDLTVDAKCAQNWYAVK